MPINKLTPVEQATFLRLILDSASEGFYSVNTEGVTTLCNAAFLRLLGYESASEVVGRKLHGEIHHTHPDGSHYDVSDCPIYKAASTGKSSYVPFELFYRKDGSSFPVEYRAEPLYEDGKLKGAICTFVDISERVAKEKELRENQEFTSSIINSSPDCIKVLDLQGRLVSMNDNGCRQMEVDDFALCINQPWIEFWAGDDQIKAKNSFAEALNGQTSSFEGFCATMKGTPKWWEIIVTPIHDANGSVHRILSISRDITERSQAQTRIKDMQEHLTLMVESAQDYAIISLDENANVVIWNAGAERIFGYKPDEVMGQNIDIIFTEEDRENKVPGYELGVAIKDGRASDERWHMRKNGERFYASGTMASMYDTEGRIKGFIKIARDMTAQQNAQELLLQARNAAEAANIAKTEFLANMSHEIRTPMNAIIGLSSILAQSQPQTQKQNDCIKTLQMSADSLLSLINDLLDIAKIEARTVDLEHVPFSLPQMMQEVISMMAVRVKEKGLTFTNDAQSAAGRMFLGDPTRLRQIVLNLCSNAIKFTEQGNVHVEITCSPTGKNGFQNVSIAVKDSGIGIASDKLDMIFQKFVQADSSINRKYGGTGLGLAITKTLIELMGGKINVTSKIGTGSTFKITIPLEVASQEDVQSSKGTLDNILQTSIQVDKNNRILLAEDYPANVMVATYFLESFGYSVEVASNGLEAFELVQKGTYIAVLMDVQMHGMSGFEATQLIREHEEKNNLPRIPIIGMTAHALAGDRERCIAVGMDDYISKPFKPDELQEKIQSFATETAAA